jgi:hypothetical protein
MNNTKKIDLAALLEEDAAPANPQICYELECGNFILPRRPCGGKKAASNG